MKFRTHVDGAATTFCSKTDFSSLHQKLKYLNALFDAMEREQADLLETGDDLLDDDDDLDDELYDDGVVTIIVNNNVNNNAAAEQDFKAAQQSAYCGWQAAVDLSTLTLEKMELYTTTTKLLEDCCAAAAAAAAAAVDDDTTTTTTTALLLLLAREQEEGTTSIAQVHFLRATALASLGKLNDAKQTLVKAIMIEPNHVEWKEQLKVWEEL